MLCGVGGSCSVSGVCIYSCGSSMVVISSFLFLPFKYSSGGTGSLAESAVPCPHPASELPNFTEFSPLLLAVSVFNWGGTSSISCFMVCWGYVFVFVFSSSGQSSFGVALLVTSDVRAVFHFPFLSRIICACMYW